MPILTNDIVEKIVKTLNPQNQLLRVWSLSGGISADMKAFEYLDAEGEKSIQVLRYPTLSTLKHYPDILAREYKTLCALQNTSIQAPVCYLFDKQQYILPEYFMILDYIEGEANFSLDGQDQVVSALASELATIHHQTWTPSDTAHLPNFLTNLKRRLDNRSGPFDQTMKQEIIQNSLISQWPPDNINQNTLLHGDFWLGNILWHDQKIVGVIDWEDAEIGDPLADLSVTRLEMLWTFGIDAMEALTSEYQQVTGISMTALPFYDLVAALRPVHMIAEWAEGWPGFGRPDITEKTLRAAHRVFVDQALAKCSSANSF